MKLMEFIIIYRKLWRMLGIKHLEKKKGEGSKKSS